MTTQCNRRRFLQSIGLGAGTLAMSRTALAGQEPPNRPNVPPNDLRHRDAIVAYYEKKMQAAEYQE
ncbi:MAG: hypothetical protein ABIP48_29010 [Planctomycetota bacterium]